MEGEPASQGENHEVMTPLTQSFIRDVQNQKIPSDHKLPQKVVDLIENVEDEF
jgi:hypothetical protein